MVKRLGFVAGATLGYVLGAKAGRHRYEQISALASKAMGSAPAQKARGAAREQASHLAEQAKDKAAGLAADAKSTVGVKVSSAVSEGRARITGAQGSEATLPGTAGPGEPSTAPRTGSGYSI